MGAPAFKQSDVQRAVKAVRLAGEKVSGVEFSRDGTFRVLTGGNVPKPALSPLEQWELEHGERAA